MTPEEESVIFVQCYCPQPVLKQEGDKKRCLFCKGIRLIPVKEAKVEIIKEDETKLMPDIIKQEREKKETIVITGKQKTLFGQQDIHLKEFSNLKQKQEVKEKVKAMFKGEMYRSIITAKKTDRNLREDKIARLDRKDQLQTTEATLAKATAFSKKDIRTLSIFPSAITMIYTMMLSKEGDKVYDPFTGHNSRATSVLNLKRKYYGYDVHNFPVEFTKEACESYNKDDYEINLGSSEQVKYPDNSFDFSITCPPYWDVEEYNKIYEEHKNQDLSNYSYEQFLEFYEKILKETYRVLKPGAFFVLVIGDTKKADRYYSLSNDTDRIAEKVGFIKHDENIYNRTSNIGGDLNYKNFILVIKRLPCIHEYILIYRKIK